MGKYPNITSFANNDWNDITNSLVIVVLIITGNRGNINYRKINYSINSNNNIILIGLLIYIIVVYLLCHIAYHLID